MILILLIAIALVLAVQSKTKNKSLTCNDLYDKCKESVTKNSFGSWASKVYSDLSGRNSCLDLFQACKKVI